MTERDVSRREQAQAVFFSVVMVLSVVAIGAAGFAGSAAASADTIDSDEVTDIDAGQSSVDHTIDFNVTLSAGNSDNISIDLTELNNSADINSGPTVNSANSNVTVETVEFNGAGNSVTDELLVNLSNQNSGGSEEAPITVTIDVNSEGSSGSFSYSGTGSLGYDTGNWISAESGSGSLSSSGTVNFNSPDSITVTEDNGNSIQYAVNNVAEDGTVSVEPGTYNESVDIAQNVTLESTDGAEETIINGTVRVDADGITFDGFHVNPDRKIIEADEQAIRVSNNNTVIESNIVSVDGEVRPDEQPSGDNSIHGIYVFEGVSEIENVTVRNNQIENIYYGAGESGGFGTGYGNIYGIHVQGNVDEATVENNTLRNLSSEGYLNAIAVNPSESTEETPTNVEVKYNNLNNITTGGAGDETIPPKSFIIEDIGDPDVDASQVTINYNNFPQPVENSGSNTLDATNNWWGATNGPSGEFIGNGSAVTGSVSVDPATVSQDGGSVNLTQDFVGVVKDSQNVTLNDTSDATFSFDSESVPGELDGTLVLGINGTDYVFENVLDDGAINTSASGAEVDSGKNGTSIANTTPTGDTTITVVGNNSTTAVEDAGTIRLVHEVQNIGEGYTLTSLPQPAEVYTTDVSDFTSWSNANSNYDNSALSADGGSLVDDSEALHKGQYANGESSDARIGYDYDTSGDRVNPGIEELNEGYNLVGSNYDISGSTVKLNTDLSTTRNVPDTRDEYQGNESFAVYDPISFGEVGGTTQVGNYEAYWVYVDTGEDSETRTIKVPKYDPAAS